MRVATAALGDRLLAAGNGGCPPLKCLIFRPIAILKWSDGNRTVPVEYCGDRTAATILLTRVFRGGAPHHGRGGP